MTVQAATVVVLLFGIGVFCGIITSGRWEIIFIGKIRDIHLYSVVQWQYWAAYQCGFF